MGQESDLLRMLEPLVRPGAGHLPGPKAAREPFETRSFDSLLAEARGPDEGSGSAAKTLESGALEALARVDRIENASLRVLVAHGGAPESP